MLLIKQNNISSNWKNIKIPPDKPLKLYKDKEEEQEYKLDDLQILQFKDSNNLLLKFKSNELIYVLKIETISVSEFYIYDQYLQIMDKIKDIHAQIFYLNKFNDKNVDKHLYSISYEILW